MEEEFSSEELVSEPVSEEVSSEEVVSESVSEEVSSDEVVSEPVSESGSEEVSSEVVVDYSSQLQQINTGLVVVSSLLFAILLGACLYGLVKWFTRLFR